MHDQHLPGEASREGRPLTEDGPGTNGTSAGIGVGCGHFGKELFLETLVSVFVADR